MYVHKTVYACRTLIFPILFNFLDEIYKILVDLYLQILYTNISNNYRYNLEEITMQTLKYSRQREAIKDFLSGRTDHPTADTIYTNIRQEFPNISLGTVYRNLALLSDMGEILKLSTGTGSDHFDANTHPHYHFICSTCQSVIDLPMGEMADLDIQANTNFGGQITGHSIFFFGTCEHCLNARKPMA